MVDLSRLFTVGKTLVAQAIATAGTTVAFSPAGAVTVDPDTLASTPAGAAAAPVRGIVTILPGSSRDALPGVALRAGDWRITLLPAEPDHDPGSIVTVTACRDARLVGKSAKVIGGARSSAGAVYLVYGRPQ